LNGWWQQAGGAFHDLKVFFFNGLAKKKKKHI